MNRLARTLALVLAVFQAGAPPVASLADASLGIGAVPATHIEDHTRRNCVPVHPDNCALCRVLSTVATPGGSASVSIPSGRAARLGVASVRETPASPDVRLQHIRGPPAN